MGHCELSGKAQQESKVEAEKAIAKEIINKLQIIDNRAIIAGGAPRDWYFNQPCSDLDCYVYTRVGICWLIKQLQYLGFNPQSLKEYIKDKAESVNKTREDAKRDVEQRDPAATSVMELNTFTCENNTLIDVKYLSDEYLKMKELWYMVNCTYPGFDKEIQIMVMKRPHVDGDYSLLESLGCSLSKIYFTGKTGISRSFEFDFAVATKTNYWKYNEYTCNDNYVQKICDKFPQFKHLHIRSDVHKFASDWANGYDIRNPY